MEVKRCSKCGMSKPRSMYHARRSASDGLQSACKDCKLIANRTWAKRHPETIERGKRASFESKLRYRERNRAVYLAHRAVKRAVDKGRLDKWPCQICGDPNTEAHHVSYEKHMQLAVTWLCPEHHGQIHRIYGKEEDRRTVAWRRRQEEPHAPR